MNNPHAFLSSEQVRRFAYVLPNAFTTAVLCLGFFACVQAVEANFQQAAIAILIAMVFDGLDGRVARWTHTESAFGAEYDSLADMVAFGAAPALVLHQWTLADLGWPGLVAALVYCAGTGLRLARFNTRLGVADKCYFQGLPCPAAAALLATFTLATFDATSLVEWRPWAAFGLTLLGGITMVSTIRFRSGKELDPRRHWPVLLFVVIALMMFAWGRPAQCAALLFAALLAYVTSGYLLALRRRSRPERRYE